MSHEDIMTLILVTIPTLLLAFVTMRENEHMYQLLKLAIMRLPIIRKKKEVKHGRHEKVEGHEKHEEQ